MRIQIRSDVRSKKIGRERDDTDTLLGDVERYQMQASNVSSLTALSMSATPLPAPPRPRAELSA